MSVLKEKFIILIDTSNYRDKNNICASIRNDGKKIKDIETQPFGIHIEYQFR